MVVRKHLLSPSTDPLVFSAESELSHIYKHRAFAFVVLYRENHQISSAKNHDSWFTYSMVALTMRCKISSCPIHSNPTPESSYHFAFLTTTSREGQLQLPGRSLPKPGCYHLSSGCHPWVKNAKLSNFNIHNLDDLLVLSREWIGCWGLLGWLLIVSQWVIPLFPA